MHGWVTQFCDIVWVFVMPILFQGLLAKYITRKFSIKFGFKFKTWLWKHMSNFVLQNYTHFSQQTFEVKKNKDLYPNWNFRNLWFWNKISSQMNESD
jgi:hypothetical protein